MPFRRHSTDSKTHRSAALAPNRGRGRLAGAVQATVEALESRQLLTALVNGSFEDTGRPVLEYKQADGSLVRISVRGNVTAEFIGGTFDPSIPDRVRLTDLVPAADEETPGVDLFQIYVVKSDINSVISLAVVPALSATPRPMQPFASGPTIRIRNASGHSEPATFGLTEGGVYIGARTPSDLPEPADNIPLFYANRRRFGMRPMSAGEMYAGLQVAKGNDLGKFLLGGTITGRVAVGGSMDTFYAGNILTGDARGLGATAAPTLKRNFFIGGDIHNLVAAKSFGTVTLVSTGSVPLEELEYKTGFSLNVVGRVGQIKALDSFLGQADIQDDARVKGPGTAQRELEIRGQALSGDATYFDPTSVGDNVGFGGGSPDPRFNNDTFDTAQFLGTARSTKLRAKDVIQLTGMLNNLGDGGDTVDYYAVPLLAGQVMEVQLLDAGSLQPRLGIFDPDGRLIASDYSNKRNVLHALNGVIRIVADRPGGYRIAVGSDGDSDFNGAADPGEIVTVTVNNPYELRVMRAGDLALGALWAGNHIATFDLNDMGIRVRRGDLGEVRAGTLATGTIFSISNPWEVDQGNFRAMEAVSLGIMGGTSGVLLGSGPDFLVFKGSVGLLNATGTNLGTDILLVNDDSNLNRRILFPTVYDDLSLVNPSLGVGKNIQLVQGAANLQCNLLAKGSIGTIRGAVVTAFGQLPPVWMANVDHVGNDGFIDLIDITGSVGNIQGGGPALSTGPGGDVRFFRAGGTIFRDRFFGGGQPEPRTLAPGETAHLTDDSGTEFAMRPIPLVRNPVIGTTPNQQFLDPGTLTVLTYPVRDKGGQVVINVSVAPGATGNGGIEIDSGARGARGAVGIGTIEISAAGIPVTFDSLTRKFTQDIPTDVTTRPPDLDVRLTGDSPIDVWSIDGPNSDFSNIINETNGEIDNITAGDINFLEARTLGLPRNSTGAALNGVNVLSTAFPFNQQRVLIQATDLTEVRSREAMGNIVAQNIGMIRPNSDGANNRSVLEGIVAPILAQQPAPAADDLTGNIIYANIGEGLTPSGTGNLAWSGLYADGIIDQVVGSGGADLRGDVIALGNTIQRTETDPTTNITASTPTFLIGTVRLSGGSIINADIMTPAKPGETLPDLTAGLAFSRETWQTTFSTTDDNDTFGEPVLDIGSIRLGGKGGIIGSQVLAADIGEIRVDGGFGVVNTMIQSRGDNVIEGVTTDGLGVRDSTIEGGADVIRVQARGNGRRVKTTAFSPSVRISERYTIDPYFNTTVDEFTDLHKYLGTTAASPLNKGLNTTGMIEDSVITGSHDLGRIEAYKISARHVVETSEATGKLVRIPFNRSDYPMRVGFANATSKIHVANTIDGLSLTSGGLGEMTAGSDVLYSSVSVSGRIGLISTGGSLRGTSYFRAQGPDGAIDRVYARRNIYSVISTTQDIGSLQTGGDLGSDNLRAGKNMGDLHVGRSIVSGAMVSIGRTLSNLFIGRDLERGATVSVGAIGKQHVGGQVKGDLIVR